MATILYLNDNSDLIEVVGGVRKSAPTGSGSSWSLELVDGNNDLVKTVTGDSETGVISAANTWILSFIEKVKAGGGGTVIVIDDL